MSFDPSPLLPKQEFTPMQKEYLDGFLRATLGGADNRTPASPRLDSARETAAPYGKGEDLGYRSQQAWVAEGRRLSKEEKTKQARNPNRMWSTFKSYADADGLPKDEDVFLYKFHGFFNTSPVQEGLMCRMRFPGGVIKAHQMECVASLAEDLGHGVAHVTTRGNLQLRRIPGSRVLEVQERLEEAGICIKGSGADNVRNITGSPLAGLDPDELFDVGPLCRSLNHAILHSPDYHGLPRKFNISFDGGGRIGCLEDTNDIGLRAVCVDGGRGESQGVSDGVYFRLALGGITGHGDLARDTGLLLSPGECLPFILAMLRVYIREGDRSRRAKARLKYLLDRWGVERFVEESEKEAGMCLPRLDREQCRFASPPDPMGHVGVVAQKQAGRFAIGLDLMAGKLDAAQMQLLSRIAREYGVGELRLTVWQNLLLPGIAEGHLEKVRSLLRQCGLESEGDPLTACLVACTGSEGCKYGMGATKAAAERITRRLRGRFPLRKPLNIHITGCPHSCAQHFIGDIGLLGCSLEEGGQGFHLFLGGGFGDGGRMARLAQRSIPEAEVPEAIAQWIQRYLDECLEEKSFSDWAHRNASDAEGSASQTPLSERALSVGAV